MNLRDIVIDSAMIRVIRHRHRHHGIDIDIYIIIIIGQWADIGTGHRLSDMPGCW